MNVALVLAGGTGTRLGEDIPKQYIEVKGKPIIVRMYWKCSGSIRLWMQFRWWRMQSGMM